jgi:glycosyltransferase involved in cell wall biosynthesis
MKVWILQTGEPLQIDKNISRAMRAMNLSSTLVNRGHQVMLWSADFDHFTKRHRYKKSKTINLNDNLQIRLINSIGYKKNQGITRLFDHAQLAIKLRFALKKEELPDIAFIGYPPIEVAWIMSRFLKKKNIPFILDVKDMWPDVLLRAFPNYARSFGKLMLTPYYTLMKSTFKSATSISSISQDFLNSSVKIANRKLNTYDSVNYLTNIEQDYSKFEIINAEQWLDKAGVSNNRKNRCSFIGSLSNAFDWELVLEAFKNINSEFVIAGDGPCFEDLKRKTKNQSNIIMLGRITGIQSKALAERTDIFIAPYNHNLEFSQSLPNKFFDAMQHGKPLLSSVTGSAAQFIIENGIGIIYSSVVSLRQALDKVESNSAQFKQMGHAASILYQKNFSGKIVYEKIIEDLEKLSAKNA